MFHVEQSVIYKNVPRGTFEKTQKLYQRNQSKLQSYLDQLLWWNKRVNLVSRSTPKEEIRQHIFHSLLLSQFPQFKDSSLIVDAGSGGGLPGIPLSIVTSQKHFIINDIVSKKMIAVQQICKKLQLRNVEINKKSIENFDSSSPFLLISKHAFKINGLLEMVKDKPWTEIILYKGLPFPDELNSLPIDITITVHKLDSGTEDSFYKNKAILSISKN